MQSKNFVVIGAGVVGLTSAWALLEAGHRVRIVERDAPGQGASHANGGQLSYRYVSPLADAGVPFKAMRWLMDPDGPLRFRLEADPAQWSWLAQFLLKCRASVNRRATQRLLALGSLSQQTFQDWAAQLDWNGSVALREPGKLVIYRQPGEFAKVRARMADTGVEQALDADACVALEPALTHARGVLAGGIFTPGEAVADCHALCLHLLGKVQAHPGFDGLIQQAATGWNVEAGRPQLRTSGGELKADAYLIAAGLHSRPLAAPLGIRLPLYPLKGYSLTAPIREEHRPPEVSVTDFERKILYARMGTRLRVAAMADLVGENLDLDPHRLASLHRSVRAMFPDAADYDAAEPWAGLRPATPGGTPILGASPLPGVWLNVGHGALGFTFSFASARIVASLMSGLPSPLALDGFTLGT
ncbi:MAG: D-amino acid dehydrogenase [Burkholderiales bacterium]|nr:D-amino acid dehydrogenase [Burkholderiales bacterium]